MYTEDVHNLTVPVTQTFILKIEKCTIPEKSKLPEFNPFIRSKHSLILKNHHSVAFTKINVGHFESLKYTLDEQSRCKRRLSPWQVCYSRACLIQCTSIKIFNDTCIFQGESEIVRILALDVSERFGTTVQKAIWIALPTLFIGIVILKFRTGPASFTLKSKS